MTRTIFTLMSSVIDKIVVKKIDKIWSFKNPRVIIQKQIHPTRVTVLCAGGLSGSFSFENMSGGRYPGMLTNFSVSKFVKDVSQKHVFSPGRYNMPYSQRNCWITARGNVFFLLLEIDIDFFRQVYMHPPTTVKAIKINFEAVSEIPQNIRARHLFDVLFHSSPHFSINVSNLCYKYFDHPFFYLQH